MRRKLLVCSLLVVLLVGLALPFVSGDVDVIYEKLTLGSNENLGEDLTKVGFLVNGNDEYLYSVTLRLMNLISDECSAGKVSVALYSQDGSTLLSSSMTVYNAVDLTHDYAWYPFYFLSNVKLVSGVSYRICVYQNVSLDGSVSVGLTNSGTYYYYHASAWTSNTGEVLGTVVTDDVYGGGGSIFGWIDDGLVLSITGSSHFVTATYFPASSMAVCDKGYGYALSGQIVTDWVANVTAGGVFNVTWIGLHTTLGEMSDPTKYAVLDSGLVVDGAFGFEVWCDDDYTGQTLYTAFRVNYTLTGESEVSALYMMEFEPDLYWGWTPSATVTPIFPTPDSSASPSEFFIYTIGGYLIALAVIVLPAVLIGLVFKGGPWGLFLGLNIGIVLGYLTLPSYVPIWGVFLFALMDAAIMFGKLRV